MLRQSDMMYRTPPGMVDEHFVYVFNADNLTDLVDYRYLVQQMDGDADFILRKVGGLREVLSNTGKWLLRDHRQADMFSAAINTTSALNLLGTTLPGEWPVLPEETYPKSSTISFDLLQVAKALVWTGCGLVNPPMADLEFWGVKRFPGSPRCSNYKYKLRPMSYPIQFLVNWDPYLYNVAGAIIGATSPRRFQVAVNNWDFELWGVTDLNLNPILLTTSPWGRIVLYDQAGKARSSGPMLIDHYAYAQTAFPAWAVGAATAPPILYEAGSVIQFDAYSLIPQWLDPALLIPNPDFPHSVELTFFGAQRIPV